MATSSDKNTPYYGSRSGPFVAILRAIEDFFNRLIGLFTLTEDEQRQAGIYLDGEGRDCDQGDK
jgi:hypothetical protein